MISNIGVKLWQFEDQWLLFTIGKLWKIALVHGNSFWNISLLFVLLYCMWWKVLSKSLILDFIMKNKCSWKYYFQIKVLFKIGIVLLLRTFFYMERFFKFVRESSFIFSKIPRRSLFQSFQTWDLQRLKFLYERNILLF